MPILVAILSWLIFAIIVFAIAWVITYVIGLFPAPNPFIPVLTYIIWIIALVIVLAGLVSTISGHPYLVI